MDDQVNDDAQTTNVDQTDSAAPDATTDQAQADVAPQPKVEPDATADRFRQDNAQLRQTLIKLGIDPDSSDAENIRNGYIDPADYVRARYKVDQHQPQPSAQPELTLAQKIERFEQSVKSVDGQVSVDDYKNQLSTAADVLKSLVQENVSLQQQRQQDQVQRVMDNCMTACRATYQADEVYSKLPQEAQAFGARLIESATDLAVGQIAQQIGFDRAANPQVYQKETAKVLQEFKSFVSALSGKRPQATQTHPANVAPVVMGQGPGQPISTPRPTMRVEDLSKNVEKYMASQRSAV